ncbi:MAG: PilZ domain-containing protein [Myxococcota bacterium]
MVNIMEVFREYMRLDRQRSRGDLSVQDLKRWNYCRHELSQTFQPGYDEGGLDEAAADRRDSLRVPTQLEVSFEHYGEVCESLMTNLSRGGLFIAVADPLPTDLLPIGSEFKLRIRIKEEEDELELTAKVVSHHTGADLTQPQPGMGVCFVKLSPSQEIAVEALYEQTMKRAVE